jgi:hypothetical protein
MGGLGEDSQVAFDTRHLLALSVQVTLTSYSLSGPCTRLLKQLDGCMMKWSALKSLASERGIVCIICNAEHTPWHHICELPLWTNSARLPLDYLSQVRHPMASQKS